MTDVNAIRAQAAGLAPWSDAARKDVPALLAEVDRLTAERDQAREEAEVLLAVYSTPGRPRQAQCGSCSQHTTLDRKDGELRALAKAARRYRHERDDARDEAALAYIHGATDMREAASLVWEDESDAVRAEDFGGDYGAAIRALPTTRPDAEAAGMSPQAMIRVVDACVESIGDLDTRVEALEQGSSPDRT